MVVTKHGAFSFRVWDREVPSIFEQFYTTNLPRISFRYENVSEGDVGFVAFDASTIVSICVETDPSWREVRADIGRVMDDRRGDTDPDDLEGSDA